MTSQTVLPKVHIKFGGSDQWITLLDAQIAGRKRGQQSDVQRRLVESVSAVVAELPQDPRRIGNTADWCDQSLATSLATTLCDARCPLMPVLRHFLARFWQNFRHHHKSASLLCANHHVMQKAG
jgi:hypothetical protein